MLEGRSRAGRTALAFAGVLLGGCLVGWLLWEAVFKTSAARHAERLFEHRPRELAREPSPGQAGAPGVEERATGGRRPEEERVSKGLLLLYAFGDGRLDLAPVTGGLADPETDRSMRLDASGPVEHRPDGLAVADGARLVSEAAGHALAERFRQTGRFTVEVVVTPADATHKGPARIVSLSLDGYKRNFTLGQEGDQWVVRLRTTETDDNGIKPELRVDGLAARRTHLAVVFDGESVRVHADGILVEDSSRIRGSLSNWDPSYALVLANEWRDGRDWAGRIESVAFYDRALTDAEVARNARASDRSSAGGAGVREAGGAAAASGGLAARSDRPWRAPEAEFRQIAELALKPVQAVGIELPLEAAPLPAVARFELVTGRETPGAVSVRVFDADGRELRCRADAVEGREEVEVTFEVPGGTDRGPYEVYYPAAGEDARPEDAPPPLPAARTEGGVRLAVYAAGQGRQARSLGPNNVVAAIQQAELVGAGHWQPQIDDRRNSFDRHDDFVAVYDGWLACEQDGRYTFGVDADDRAVLLVDGRPVLSGGRPDRVPDRPFQDRSMTTLRAGIHRFAFVHSQTTGALRARLAWQPPGARTMRLIPPSAFATHRTARVVGLECRDRSGGGVFFSAAARRRLVANRVVPITVWQLAAPHPATLPDLEPETGATRWSWREGGREIGAGAGLALAVSGLENPEADVRPYREITLALIDTDGEEVGSFTRRLRAVPPDPLEDEPVVFRLDVLSAPTFAYPADPVDIELSAVNDSEQELTLELVEMRLGGRAGAVSADGQPEASARSLGAFELPPVAPGGADVLAKRTRRVSRRFAAGELAPSDRVAYTLGLASAPAEVAEIEVLGSRARLLPGLTARDGAIWTAGGARAVFVLPWDSEADHRRWSLIGAIGAGDADNARMLLYGDSMASPGAAGGDGLAPRLRRALAGTRLDASPFPAGDYPIQAAAAGADRELARSPWSRVWLSLGLADVRSGTPLDQYRRGIDFVIDRARVVRPGARFVVVGPPPEWGREAVSRLYAAAAREVAEQHFLPFVDLHRVVESLSDPKAAYREPGVGDGVHFPYPLGRAMDAVARAVVDG